MLVVVLSLKRMLDADDFLADRPMVVHDWLSIPFYEEEFVGYCRIAR